MNKIGIEKAITFRNLKYYISILTIIYLLKTFYFSHELFKYTQIMIILYENNVRKF